MVEDDGGDGGKSVVGGDSAGEIGVWLMLRYFGCVTALGYISMTRSRPQGGCVSRNVILIMVGQAMGIYR